MIDDSTPIEVLEMPGSLIFALKELGHHSVESAFLASMVAPGPMMKFAEAHLKPNGKRFSNFIAECTLHLTASWLKYVSERTHESEVV